MDLDSLTRTYQVQHQAHQRRVGELTAVANQRKQLQQHRLMLEANLRLLEDVSVFLTSFVEEAQQQMQVQIELLVTHALHSIFGDDMTFRLVPATKGKQSTLDFVVESNMSGIPVITPVMDARGGGVAAVIGFILRLVVIMLSPTASRLIVLDESFAQVSEEYEGRVAEFLRELADKAGVQVLMVTHSTAYTDVADKCYRFRLENGTTKVEEV